MLAKTAARSLLVTLAVLFGAVAVVAPLAIAASTVAQHGQAGVFAASPSMPADGTWPGTGGPRAANQYTGYPYRAAPDCTAGAFQCVADRWLFFQGQCTSWVAYRLNQLNGIAFNNSYGGLGNWGDAAHWGSHATALGLPPNGAPAVGAVAWYSSGHVAYVERVNSATSVDISEMNYDHADGFRVRTITTASGWPTGFIHIKDLTGPSGPSDETLVRITADLDIYRVAGGAPLHVSTWTALAGPQPVRGVSPQQFDGRPHPGSAPPPAASSPVTAYDFRYEQAPYGGPFTAWVSPAALHGLPATGVTAGLSPGYDYCYEVRTHNQAGQIGPWSPARCVTDALDDRSDSSLSAGWVQGSSARYFLGTDTQTTTSGAWWARTGTALDRVGVVATLCSTCGSLTVYVNGALVGSISLHSSTLHYQQMLSLKPFTLRTGTLLIKVTSATGHLVQLDGVLISRT